MVEVKNKGPNYPHDMVVDVDKDRAKKLVNSKEFVYVHMEAGTIEPLGKEIKKKVIKKEQLEETKQDGNSRRVVY